MRLVYVVFGETDWGGEFESWNVVAFLDRELALKFVEDANNWLKHHDCLADFDRKVSHKTLYNSSPPLCPFDPNLRVACYTGSRYGIFDIGLVEQ